MNELRKSGESVIPEIVAQVLLSRGMSTDEIQPVFYPGYGAHLYAPFLVKDLDKVVDWIVLA